MIHSLHISWKCLTTLLAIISPAICERIPLLHLHCGGSTVLDFLRCLRAVWRSQFQRNLWICSFSSNSIPHSLGDSYSNGMTLPSALKEAQPSLIWNSLWNTKMICHFQGKEKKKAKMLQVWADARVPKTFHKLQLPRCWHQQCGSDYTNGC